jgi:hypothetical protein
MEKARGIAYRECNRKRERLGGDLPVRIIIQVGQPFMARQNHFAPKISNLAGTRIRIRPPWHGKATTNYNCKGEGDHFSQ